MRSRNGAGLGTVTLVMLFSVMCLCVFALLSLSTARSELNLSTRYADSVKAYYEADTQAVYLQNRLISAVNLEATLRRISDGGYDIRYERGLISYSVPVDDNLTLMVELSGTDYTPITWQVVATGAWEADDHIEVWDGES